jgi:glycosyltransferase involved in cell wall biosynthesis
VSSVDVSVALTCLNAAEHLTGQLDALRRQETDVRWEIVVADGGSTDGTLALLRQFQVDEHGPRLRVVDASDKRGIAHGFNVAARSSRGDRILFCEADDEVGEGWLDAMARALETNELVASRQDATRLNDTWVQEARVAGLEHGLQRSWFPPYLPHASTMGLGSRRELYERVGGFDESVPVLQDMDFCFAAQLAGATLVFVPDAVVHYRFRTRFVDIYRQARLYSEHLARIQRKYKPRGSSLPGEWKWPLRSWKPIFEHAARAHKRSERGALAWSLGWQVGRVRGSVKHRVLAV